MGADDVVEGGFGDEAEFAGPPGIEAPRPVPDDGGDRLIGFLPDKRDGLFARDAAQRLPIETRLPLVDLAADLLREALR